MANHIEKINIIWVVEWQAIQILFLHYLPLGIQGYFHFTPNPPFLRIPNVLLPVWNLGRTLFDLSWEKVDPDSNL